MPFWLQHTVFHKFELPNSLESQSKIFREDFTFRTSNRFYFERGRVTSLNRVVINLYKEECYDRWFSTLMGRYLILNVYSSNFGTPWPSNQYLLTRERIPKIVDISAPISFFLPDIHHCAFAQNTVNEVFCATITNKQQFERNEM